MPMIRCQTCRDKRFFQTKDFGKIPCPICNRNYHEEPTKHVDPRQYIEHRNPPKGVCRACGRSTGCIHPRHLRINLQD